MGEIEKAFAIENAKISFVSLVDKAANLKQFLITKSRDGRAAFATCGKIVKADAGSHFVTGIVYEPMVEDSQGNYMTEAEITKAAHWFAKNSSKVDLQHSFEPLEGASVVESWIAKSDSKIGDTDIKKGTWLMTVEIDDEVIWKSIEQGKITGFSMGGVGDISKVDTDLSAEPEPVKKSILKRLGELFSGEHLEKGELKDAYNAQKEKEKLRQKYWDAEDALRCLLFNKNGNIPSADTVKSILSDFSDIVVGIFSERSESDDKGGEKVEKSGRKFSGKNKSKLQEVYNTLRELLNEAENEQNTKGDINSQQGDKGVENAENAPVTEEVHNVNKADIESVVIAAVEKALGKAENPVEKNREAEEFSPTEENISKMVNAAVEKALASTTENGSAPAAVTTAEDIQKMIDKAVEDKVAPILKQRGLPTNLGSDDASGAEEALHYMHGIL